MSERKTCRACGQWMFQHAATCPHCGAAQADPAPPPVVPKPSGPKPPLQLSPEETRALLAAGHAGTASAYLVGTLGACLLAVAVADRFSAPVDRRLVEAEEGDW